MSPVEEGPVVIHGDVGVGRRLRAREEVPGGDRVEERPGPRVGLDDIGRDVLDAVAVDEIQGLVEDGGVVLVEAEDEGAHHLDACVVHPPHAIRRRSGLVRPFVDGPEAPLVDRFDPQEQLPAPGLVRQLQEVGLVGQIDRELGGPCAAERPHGLEDVLDGSRGVVEVVVPEEEAPRIARADVPHEDVAPPPAQTGQARGESEERVVGPRGRLADRLAGVAAALPAEFLDHVLDVAVADGGPVHDLDGAEVAVELAASSEGRGGEHLLGSRVQALPDVHVQVQRPPLADPLEPGVVHGLEIPPRREVGQDLSRRPLSLAHDGRVHVSVPGALIRDGRGVRSSEDDRHLPSRRLEDAPRLAGPAVGFPGGVGVGRDHHEVHVPARKIGLLGQDPLEGSRPFNLVVLDDDAAPLGQEMVLPEEADDVGEADARAPEERAEAPVEVAEHAPASDRLVYDVRVTRCDADEVADGRYGRLLQEGLRRWDRPPAEPRRRSGRASQGAAWAAPYRPAKSGSTLITGDQEFRIDPGTRCSRAGSSSAPRGPRRRLPSRTPARRRSSLSPPRSA